MPEWPHPVGCGEENEFSPDVLINGGGLAGFDHWRSVLTNP